MTLLESIVAFVLLAVVGIACLDLSRGATGLEVRSVEWSRAVATGESALAAAAAGVPTDDAAFHGVQLTRTPWRDGADGIDLVDVEVPLETGAAFHATRLVRRVMPAGAAP